MILQKFAAFWYSNLKLLDFHVRLAKETVREFQDIQLMTRKHKK